MGEHMNKFLINNTLFKRILVTFLIILTFICLVEFTKNIPLYGDKVVYDYSLNGPSGVFAGKNDRYYIIDGGRKTVLSIDSEDRIYEYIKGGSDKPDAKFYYASDLCDDDSGNLYIADVIYGGKGTLVKSERISKLEDYGRGKKTLIYEKLYSDEDFAPMQYGNIKSLDEKDGMLIFSFITDNGFAINSINLKTNEISSIPYEFTKKISAIAVDTNTMEIAVSTKTGEIVSFTKEGQKTLLAENKNQIPWKLQYVQGLVYYSELNSQSIQMISPYCVSSEIMNSDNILQTVSLSHTKLYSTDNNGVYIFNLQNKEIREIFNYKVRITPNSLFAWFSFLEIILVFIYLLIKLIKVIISFSKKEMFERTVLVILVSIISTSLASYIILSATISSQNTDIINRLNVFGDILSSSIDIQALEEIKETSQYDSSSYNEIKSSLDNLTKISYENQAYYYYIIYKGDQKYIYGLMDYEDTMTSYHPFYLMDDNNIYTQVLNNNEEVEVKNDISSYGAWSFVLKPVQNSQGQAIGILEVGTSLDQYKESQNKLIWNIILNALSSSVVLLMLMIELVFYFSKDKEIKLLSIKSLNIDKKALIGSYPVRTFAFVTFFVDCMQDAFIAILLFKIYEPIMGIPKSIGVALPMTLQLFAAAFFSLVGASIINKVGFKKTLISGFVFQFSGFLVCAITGTYYGLLVGKLLIGAGSGIVMITINTIAAISDEETAAKTFSDINAGILSGVTVGVGLGSLILSVSTYRSIYITGAIFVALMLIRSFYCIDYTYVTKKVKANGMNFIKFFKNKEVFTFLVFILFPFLVSISYREYFFPLYAEQSGISEVDIGRIYLWCGLLVIYSGPIISKILMKRFGSKNTVIISSALACCAIIMPVIDPSLSIAIIGVILLSISTSFGYAAQSTYFASLPSTELYGESKSMSIYSVFDNGGQTLGPVVYGFALIFGRQMGLLGIGLAIFALLLLFVALNMKGSEKDD